MQSIVSTLHSVATHRIIARELDNGHTGSKEGCGSRRLPQRRIPPLSFLGTDLIKAPGTEPRTQNPWLCRMQLAARDPGQSSGPDDDRDFADKEPDGTVDYVPLQPPHPKE